MVSERFFKGNEVNCRGENFIDFIVDEKKRFVEISVGSSPETGNGSANLVRY
jgi:hypothetical protein